MRIYPSPGLRVRDPVKRDFLPITGREVPDDDYYWLRRLNCNDATLTAPELPPAVEDKPELPPAINEKLVKATKPETHKGSDS
ncbi:hypothetical protein PS870_06531 [Pseudomonas fluorescens]|uniref:DUF2635 domain-containing protein n=1 Tax=Pseudomonas fluorescens TaxID=294 RepID=A0A5E7QJB1_PSEFL|nr:DUF2635 domain-containing protein [Pseudomonas fluorescens]VVP62141.1 hypothetical protein PS870_06531 [Pseudomonas fluorescens]